MSKIKELKVGSKAPVFSLPSQDEEKISLKQFLGKWVVLYFYPKDNTSGCTVEALDFTARIKEFEQLNAVVLGVSPDSPQCHAKFIQKKELKVALLSDVDHQMMETYGVWQKKKMYGREYMGVVRTTYLIDPKGKIVRIWPKVKVKEHAEEVKQELVELQKG